MANQDFNSKKDLTIISESTDPRYKSLLASKSITQYCFILSNGDVYLDESKQSDSAVLSYLARAEALLKKENIALKKRIHLNQADFISAKSIYVKSKTGAKKDTNLESKIYKIINDAVIRKASDIHIKVETSGLTYIGYRVDGRIVWLSDTMSGQLGENLISNIYTMLSDVSDTNFIKSKPQDARMLNKVDSSLNPELYSIRIGTAPRLSSKGGDSTLMVLRLVTKEKVNSLKSLGMHESQIDDWEYFMERPFGLAIIGGPTGSGKSKTLFCNLSKIIKDSQGELNVITVEDPPEAPLDGANQLYITNSTSELERKEEFSKLIRAALRLDPDILGIGECRDLASMQLAIDSALTGHLTFTTIHANTPIGILDRMTELGVNMATVCDPDYLSLLSSQRLVRKLCPHCKIKISESDFDNLASKSQKVKLSKIDPNRAYCYIANKKGCQHCSKGELGRTCIASTLLPDVKFYSTYLKGNSVEAMKHALIYLNHLSLSMHARVKVLSGEVDFFAADREVDLLPKYENSLLETEPDFRIKCAKIGCIAHEALEKEFQSNNLQHTEEKEKTDNQPQVKPPKRIVRTSN